MLSKIMDEIVIWTRVVYKMEYQHGEFTAIPTDNFGRMMFPPYPDDDD